DFFVAPPPYCGMVFRCVGRSYGRIFGEVETRTKERPRVGEPLVELFERGQSPVVDDLRLAVLVDDLRAFERTERLVASGRLVRGATGRILDDPRGDPVVPELLPKRDAMVAIQDLVGTIGPPAHHRGRRVRGGDLELLFDRVGPGLTRGDLACEVLDVPRVVVAADREEVPPLVEFRIVEPRARVPLEDLPGPVVIEVVDRLRAPADRGRVLGLHQ